MEKIKEIVPFWQDIVIILSVFVIALSTLTIIGVSRLNAASQKQIKGEVKEVVLVSSQEKKEVTVAAVQPLPAPTESVEPAATVKEEAIVKDGEGIEHALIRQLRVAEPERGKKWAQKRAHQIAVLSGFVDSGGNEVRVKDGSDQVQVAYVLSGGQIITYSQGQEVRRTQIADDYQHVQTINLQPFEFQYGSG